ncbi:hypothetical protein [Sphingobacterium yanglingense]|uniref:Outer membrane protein with beta-barrel domain n=1 Tax=Sphingobacterium yanglingense TaxID=1437280 RepID=A0A4R6WP68_9SPHI|nr:hypothetical protein [Sphingobacterium yanglingense]TDQ78025.1 hypothetical protein CLV99_2001 [Sphingobacterium yanglingense]
MRLFFTLLGTLVCFAVSAQKKLDHKFSFGMNYVVGSSENRNYDSWSEAIEDDYLSLKFDYVASFKLNQFIAVGPGVGIRHLISLDETSSDRSVNTNVFGYSSNTISNYFAIPVFVNFNARFIDKKVSPFLSVSTGYSFALNDSDIELYDINSGGRDNYTSKIKSGFIANAQAGANVRFRNGMNISAGPYFEFQPTSIVRTSDAGSRWTSDKVKRNLYHIGLQVGFAF